MEVVGIQINTSKLLEFAEKLKVAPVLNLQLSL